MTKLASLLTLLTTVLVCLLPSAPALALRDRVFVASYGSDTNPCTFGSPCKTFQQAVDVVAPGGEVTAIDSAGFGTMTIIHAVTVTSPNGIEAGIAAPASGAAAITINAGSNDVVSLNGLTLDGDAVTTTKGILFNSGGGLQIQNSVIRNFEYGIDFVPSASSQLSVFNTLVANNALHAIYIAPTGSGTTVAVLRFVEMLNNLNSGLIVGSSAGQTVNVTVSDCVSANNNNAGIGAGSSNGTPLNVTVRNCIITGNQNTGVVAEASAGNNGTGTTLSVARSTITGNGTGWFASQGAAVTSFGDNNISNNGTANNAPPPSAGYE